MVSGQQTPQRGVRVSMQRATWTLEDFGLQRPWQKLGGDGALELSAKAQVAAAPRLATGC